MKILARSCVGSCVGQAVPYVNTRSGSLDNADKMVTKIIQHVGASGRAAAAVLPLVDMLASRGALAACAVMS
jgi:hypothetical protein